MYSRKPSAPLCSKPVATCNAKATSRSKHYSKRKVEKQARYPVSTGQGDVKSMHGMHGDDGSAPASQGLTTPETKTFGGHEREVQGGKPAEMHAEDIRPPFDIAGKETYVGTRATKDVLGQGSLEGKYEVDGRSDWLWR